MKVVFDENLFDEIDHFHPSFDESVPNRVQHCNQKSENYSVQLQEAHQHQQLNGQKFQGLQTQGSRVASS